MSTFGFADGVLFVVGLYWCCAMFRRWRSDLDALCTSRAIRDWAVISVRWGVTVFIVVCLIVTSAGLVRSIAHI